MAFAAKALYGVIAKDQDGNVAVGCGTSVPSASSRGYSHGCIFIKTNGTTEADALYINSGTSSSCSFSALDLNFAEAALLSGLTVNAALLNQLTDLTATGAELNGLDLSVVGAVAKTKMLPFTTTAGTTAVSTGFTFPTKAVLLNAFIDCTTADSGKTLSVGDGAGSANEFLATITIGSTGVKVPSLAAGSVTLGSSLIETVTDSGSATHSARKWASVGGVAVSYKTSAAATTAGNIFLQYIELA